MVEYTEQRLQGMSPIQLWVELGLHKGFIGHHTKDNDTRFFYLGTDQYVGNVHKEGRGVLDQVHVEGHVCELLKTFDPHAKWEGPIVPSRWKLTADKQRAVEHALSVINGTRRLKPSIGKPALKLKSRIAKEDRPDWGRTLMFHGPSKTYTLMEDPDEVAAAKERGYFDVTGDKKHEAAFSAGAKPKPKFKAAPPSKPKLNLRHRP